MDSIQSISVKDPLPSSRRIKRNGPQRAQFNTSGISDVIKSPIFIIGDTERLKQIINEVSNPKSILKTTTNKHQVKLQREGARQIGFTFND